MSQYTTSPSPAIEKLARILAELVTPDSHVPRRWEFKNRLLRRAGVEIGPNAAIDRGFRWLRQGGKVAIGEEAALGENLRLYNFGDVSIGCFAMFAADVLIANGGHDTNSFEPFSGPINVGRGVWVGTGASIVGTNITIGDNAIVGAGALVIGDVPAGAIVAGRPARFIRMRELPPKVWHLGGRYFSPVTFTKVQSP